MKTPEVHVSLRVGDQVRFTMGRRELSGVILQDRGPIGVEGRHLYQVEVPQEPLEPTLMELREDEVELIDADLKSAKSIESERVVEYLVNGGLVGILRSNLSGGRNQPRVWLCLSQLGNVTHTFVAERGIVGGETVPFAALNDHHIFTPKVDEVRSLLKNFGLSSKNVERVVAEVGTSP